MLGNNRSDNPGQIAGQTADAAGGSPRSGHGDSESRLRALAAQRIAIEGVSIEIDGGRFAAKAVAGQESGLSLPFYFRDNKAL